MSEAPGEIKASIPELEAMTVLVVDDEPPARARLGRLLGDVCPDAAIIEAGNGVEALARVKESAPDVVLLDVRMPGMDGLEVARHLVEGPARPAVIFTTAYDTHAVEAFDAEALDYLLKPVRRHRLVRALARASELRRSVSELDEVRTRSGFGERTHFNASAAGSIQLVPVAEVRYLRADNKYIEAATASAIYLIEESLASIEAEFPDRFVRVHRNALVARANVRALERDGDGKHHVLLRDVDERIEVSRRMVRQVKELFRE
ncbi:MAG: LytTR family DNA-binding domain-containing protein [Pseudomonadota bacterium]